MGVTTVTNRTMGLRQLLLLPLLFASSALAGGQGFEPPVCPSSTPPANDTKNCTLQAPPDPEFSTICKPGSFGHEGGAEQPTNRCGGQNYSDVHGTFRCACCGEPLFIASTFYPGPPGDGWPAFHGNGSVKEDNGKDHVCTPLAGDSEVVCSKCGAHLGDFFKSGGGQPFESYYCVDGVCMLPPGAPAGHVCQPAADGMMGNLTESSTRIHVGHHHHHHSHHHHHHH